MNNNFDIETLPSNLQICVGHVIQPDYIKSNLVELHNNKYTGEIVDLEFYKGSKDISLKEFLVTRDIDENGLYQVSPKDDSYMNHLYKNQISFTARPFKNVGSGLVLRHLGNELFLPRKLAGGNLHKLYKKSKISVIISESHHNKYVVDTNIERGLHSAKSSYEEREDYIKRINSVIHNKKKIVGKITGVTDYGVFVEADEFEGRKALLHKSQIGRRIYTKKLIEEKFTVGLDVEVNVIEYNKNRLSLSTKELNHQSENKELERAGSLTGTVKNYATGIGSFIRIDGWSIIALIRDNDIDQSKWSDKNAYKKIGNKSSFKVKNIKPDGKVNLSQ